MKRDPEVDALVMKYGKQYPNCAQTSFLATLERNHIACDVPSFVRALTAFPGIGGTGETCGAVSGSLLAMGLALGPTDHTDRAQAGKCHVASHQFCQAVKQEFGSTDCGGIIEGLCGRRYDLSNPEEAKQYAEAGGLMKCAGVVSTAVHIATGILEKDKSERRVAQ
jgi:C_GCAxxG_C_C family probable redox protein